MPFLMNLQDGRNHHEGLLLALLQDILLKHHAVYTQVGGQAVLGRQDASPTPWLTERHGYDPTCPFLYACEAATLNAISDESTGW